MRPCAFAVLGVLFLMMSAVPAPGREIRRDFHEQFEVTEGVRLDMKHGDGDVVVTPWDRDVIDIEVHYRADVTSVGIGGKHDFEVEFRETDDAVYVIGKERTGPLFGYVSKTVHEHTYAVRAPAYVELELHGDDGSIEIEGWRGAIHCALDDGDVDLREILSPITRVEFADGDVRVDGLRGELHLEGDDGDAVLAGLRSTPCRVRLDDGDVTMEHCEGEFEIRVDDGDIAFRRVRASVVDIRTDDGDADLDLLNAGHIDLDVVTDDGDITVELEPGMSAAFSILVDDGRIDVDLPGAQRLKESRREVSGEIGGGEGQIRIRAEDGRVSVSERR